MSLSFYGFTPWMEDDCVHIVALSRGSYILCRITIDALVQYFDAESDRPLTGFTRNIRVLENLFQRKLDAEPRNGNLLIRSEDLPSLGMNQGTILSKGFGSM